MGSCLSKDAGGVRDVNPAPHPHARRMWVVATALDASDVPADLVGVDADGLKAALRNRGLETEHWALEVDPLAQHKHAQPHIFDITVQAGRLASSAHTPASWSAITRRVCLGWTAWKDEEITGAQKLLIQARPKYDGRTNNFQQLARLLARHIEFVPQPVCDTPAKESSGHTPLNASQMTLVSAPQSASGPSTDTEAKTAVNSAPASIHKTHRVSTARPPLAKQPAHARILHKQRQSSHPAPPASERQTHRQSTYDLSSRTRAQSDASQAYAGEERRSRRKSEAPGERVAEMRAARNKSRSSSQRDSVLSYGGSAHAAWPPLPLAYGMVPNMWPSAPLMHPGMAMPFFPHAVHPGFMPPLMPVLAPPSPGFHSQSSAVPTPPESPHLPPAHFAKPLPALARPHRI